MNFRVATNFSLTGPPRIGKPGQPDHEVVVLSAGAPRSDAQRAYDALVADAERAALEHDQ